MCSPEESYGKVGTRNIRHAQPDTFRSRVFPSPAVTQLKKPLHLCGVTTCAA